jgi:hypothetical protein
MRQIWPLHKAYIHFVKKVYKAIINVWSVSMLKLANHHLNNTPSDTYRKHITSIIVLLPFLTYLLTLPRN